MRRSLFLVVVIAAGVLADVGPAAAVGPYGWEPTSDWCGFTWRQRFPDGFVHNGWDIWTLQYPATGGISGARGFPVQLPAEGVLKDKYTWPGTNKLWGLRFDHPALGLSTTYWHMAHLELGSSITSYVESTLVKGNTYPVGTFLGYQGDLTGLEDTVTHLHLTVTDLGVADNGTVEVSRNPGNAGGNPTYLLGRDLDAGVDGSREEGKCWMAAQDVHYRGPLPESEHNYANDELRWYAIVNTDVTAEVTRAEFCDLLTDGTGDKVTTYNYDIQAYETFSGHLTPPSFWTRPVSAGSQAASRVLFLRFTSNASGRDYGFRVCGVSSDPGPPIVEVATQRTSYEDLGSPTKVELTFGAKPVQGDLLVANIAVNKNGSVSQVPAGWNLAVESDPDQPYAHVGGIYYKIAGADEPRTHTWRLNGSPNWAYGWASEWYGAGAVPLDRAVMHEGNDATLSSGPVGTLTQENELVFAVFRKNGQETIGSHSGGLTEIYETNSQQTISIATTISSSSADVTYTATTSLGHDYVVLVATFKR